MNQQQRSDAARKAAETRRARKLAQAQAEDHVIRATVDTAPTPAPTVAARAGIVNPFQVGDQVRVTAGRYQDEQGKILTFCGPHDARYAVVWVPDAQPNIPVEQLEAVR